MIPGELEAKIRRLHHAEGWKPGTIAKQLGVHHETVRRVLRDDGVPATAFTRRRSLADPFVPLIVETLTQYPTLRASRLYQMVKQRGYTGAAAHFRTIVARYRPKPAAEAYLRLRTLPGEQAQVDWAHFGHVEIDGARRPLVAFMMVPSWSRMIFLRFGTCQRTGSFLAHHADAFEAFGGVPRLLLYDNLQSAVTERVGDAIRFNEALLAFASHHRYEPRPVAPYRGNEKGRVERAVRFARDSFFPARTWRDLDDLDAQAKAWCEGEAAARRHPEDRTRTVADAFAEEREALLALPADAFPAADRVEVHVGKTPYVCFDGNDDSVPHDRVRRTLVALATRREVRVLDGAEEVARHPRCWGKGRLVEDEAHVAALVAAKREAREGRGMNRLLGAVPACRALLERVAERGGNVGGTTNGLNRLLDDYGVEALTAAVSEAVAADAPHVAGVRQVLDRRRRLAGQPPPVPIPLPDDPRVRELAVKPHSLDAYDRLGRKAGGHDA
ncbi:MAG: IS21 family transposase [Myxococcota bacterium]